MRARSLSCLAMVLVAAGCGSSQPPALTAERLVLERELTSLNEYLQLDLERLFTEADLLIIVREELMARLIGAALPVEGPVGERYRVRLDRVAVGFRTGLATFELQGRASLAARPTVFAEVTLHAALEVAGILGDPPLLQARPEVLAIETRALELGGVAAGGERIADELTRRYLPDLNALLGTLQLPIALDEVVRLPAVAGGGVTIPALDLRLGMRVQQVLVADRRLWVTVGLDLATGPGGGE